VYFGVKFRAKIHPYSIGTVNKPFILVQLYCCNCSARGEIEVFLSFCGTEYREITKTLQFSSGPSHYVLEKYSVEGNMKFKVNEDWLSVGIALLLMVLALVGLIDPNWMKF
jgi:hypothetical protein